MAKAKKTTAADKDDSKKVAAAKAAEPAKAAKAPAKAKAAEKGEPAVIDAAKKKTAGDAPRARAPRGGATIIPVEEFRAVEERTGELPLEYGDTKVVLLTRDPEWIFAYWELSEPTRKQHGLNRGGPSRSLALRVFEKQGNSEAGCYDVVVNDYTSSWYIKVPQHADTIQVELGLYDTKGNFVKLATSNVVDLPRMAISERADVEFAEINDEIYEQILHLSGGVKVSERLGSDEFLKSLQNRIFESLFGGPMSSAGLSSGMLASGSGVGLSSFTFGFGSSAMSSGLFSGLFHGETFSSAGLPSAIPHAGGENTIQRKASQKDDFWLEVGVDVIVYGATEPDAKVRFMGQEITLNGDGTFRFRMVFPDTTIEFPVEAVSANGRHTRRVKPVVTRFTEGDPRKPV